MLRLWFTPNRMFNLSALNLPCKFSIINQKKVLIMNPVSGKSNILQAFYSSFKKNEQETKENPVDTIEFSDTSKAFAKLDNFLNLGKRDRLDITDLNDSEKKEFLKMLATLLQKGIVGYEVLEVNGKPEKHYIVNQIGDQRIYGAKQYKKKGYY